MSTPFTPKTVTNPDPFNPESLRLDQSFAETGGVKKLITTVPVRKPGKYDFVRVHPDPAYRWTPAAVIELKEERETYLLTAEMASALPGEFNTAALFLTINRQRVLSLWPIKLPDQGGKSNAWHDSAAEAAERAMGKWIRVQANMSLGAYDVAEATGQLSDPTWPDMPFSEILRIAFRGHIIDSIDHPLVQRLRGLA